MAQLNFNATNVPQLEAVEAIPTGWYNAKIVESEMKPTNDQTGSYLAVTFQILDGQFVNRKLFTNVNLQNKNPVAAEIGMKTLSAICHSTGVIQVQDSQQLHGIPLQIKVSLKPAGAGNDGKSYEASNDVKGYKRYEQPAQQPGFGAPAGVAGTPAWMQPAPAVQQASIQQFSPAAQQQVPQQMVAPHGWQQPAPVAQQFQQPAPMQQPAFQPPQQQAPMPWQVQAAPQQAPIEQPAAQQQWQQPAMQQAPVQAQQMPQQGAPAQHAASHAGFQGQPAPAAQQVAPAASQPTPPWAS